MPFLALSVGDGEDADMTYPATTADTGHLIFASTRTALVVSAPLCSESAQQSSFTVTRIEMRWVDGELVVRFRAAHTAGQEA
jgi:hypothetical protein